MIPPQLIVFAIMAMVRLARAADSAAAQYARDRAIALPSLDLPALNDDNRIRLAISNAERDRVVADAVLGPLWKRFDTGKPGDEGYDEARSRMLIEAAGIFARANVGASAAGKLAPGELGAAIMVGQWRKGAGPRDPLTGVALTLLDVGLEFVALEPSMLGVRKGEKLIGAFAQNLALIIEPEKQPQRSFAEEVFTTFVRAALTTLHENADLLATDKAWSKLVKNTVQPIVATLSTAGDDAFDLRLRNFADLLLGPVFKAALATIAETPEAFLGDAAKNDTLPGIVIAALLHEGTQRDLTAQFSEAGMAALVRATLAAMAAHSELIIAANKTDMGGQVAREVVKQVLATLSQKEWQGTAFAGDLGLQLAAAALLGVKNGSAQVFKENEPWQALAARMLAVVVDSLAGGLKSGGIDLAAGIFSKERVLDLGRVFLEQAAKTPAMIAGKNAELAGLVKAVAAAMAKDKYLLLGHAEWLEIARVAAQEAAANPGRLFKVSDGAGGSLASALLAGILALAAKEAEERKAAGDALLFGPTLRELIVHTLSTAAGNFAKLAEANNVDAVNTLLKNLLALTATDGEMPKKYGAKELLRLFKVFLPQVLATGVAPELREDKIVAALSASPT